ncbi:polysaccharide deacetylase family protein [Methylobacterium gnaphalii]|nr:polysaccharide deacetylase family protein [Methylobacterium gnaphalii]
MGQRVLNDTAMGTIERGWSGGRDRQLWRLLARAVPGHRRTLRGDGPVASITFDDVPESAATTGAAILDRHDARATYFVAAALCGRQDRYWRVADRARIRDLSEAGHEIGCHTARHVNVQSLRGLDLLRECEVSSAMIAEICGRAPRNFCYPFGDVGLIQKRMLAQRFDTCRTIYEHPNAGRVDPAMLGAYGLFDTVMDHDRLRRILRRTVARRGWLILYTHDIADEPTPMGATPHLLDETLGLLAEHGIPVMTVAEAARHHGLVATS